MSRFFVGQRVRLVRPYRPENMGRTGVIVQMYPEEHLGFPGPCNCAVKWSDGAMDSLYEELGGYATHTDQLEPILDRHEPCEAEFKESLDELLSREVKNETVK